MKNVLIIALFMAILIFTPHIANAQEVTTSQSSADILIPELKNQGNDNRAQVLEAYLRAQNSPLTDNARDFIEAADRNGLDWKLVAAISGVESTFGQEIPTNSHNAWGWGVYGDNVIRFSSWKEGIDTISQGLREKYMDEWGGKDIYEIGNIYASSPAWAGHVNYFLDKIAEFALNDTKNTLSLSL